MYIISCLSKLKIHNDINNHLFPVEPLAGERELRGFVGWVVGRHEEVQQHRGEVLDVVKLFLLHHTTMALLTSCNGRNVHQMLEIDILYMLKRKQEGPEGPGSLT